MIPQNVKWFFVSLLLFSMETVIIAQNNPQAEKIINSLLQDAKTNAIRTNFKLTTENKKNQHTSTGSFTLKGNKFTLDMQEMKVWFDGKTQWSYLPHGKEVSISEPSDTELAETNPMVVLSKFKSKSNIQFSSTQLNEQHCIELRPKVKMKDFEKIEVKVSKKNNNLLSLKISSSNGSFSLISLSDYQKGLKISDAYFVFNPSNYKGVMINDLR